ncbi:SH3 domain-containing protein [Halomonas sp. MCCC 1A11036]|uniref:SH3 domain-containing protein n=1 Tax=Billgrantia zhangzhouensis TaxID=2733481 RepID=A0ABS9AEM6_9GAMM|nr:SH3 domain-containing protein [Halomonas zhangzhouensis]MCE8020161.1 SH3 domain-containing protein [Halomonas zhangzhouensis]
MRRFGIAALAIMLMSLSLLVLAIEKQAPEPIQRYRVTGVAATGGLNVRSQPEPSAEIVSTLEPDASDVVVSGTRIERNGAVWWQVVGGDGLGWINARYLAPVDEAPPSGEVFPLRCTGTEPFWSLKVADDEARFETPMDEDETWQAGPMTRAMGLIGRYAIRLENEGGVGHLTAWRNHGFCSDGMSDIGFPYEGIVVTPNGTVHAGCCLRAGE